MQLNKVISNIRSGGYWAIVAMIVLAIVALGLIPELRDPSTYIDAH